MSEAWTIYRIRFVEQTTNGEAVLMQFRDPIPRKAVFVVVEPKTDIPEKEDDAALDILAVPEPNQPDLVEKLIRWVAQPRSSETMTPITTKLHGASFVWRHGRAAVQAAPERIPSILSALVEFCYYENELRKLERETAESWPQLEADTPLACEVKATDAGRTEQVNERMKRAFQRRARLERLAPHLYQSGACFSSLAGQLRERLREKLRTEYRIQTLQSQFEVFERVYEMTSQRVSEFHAARKLYMLEWTIIILLASETLLLLTELLWTLNI